MTSYGSVPLDGTKQVAYEVTGKGPLLTNVILGDDKSLFANGEVRDKELKRWEKVMAEGASRAPPALVPCLKACAPYFSWVVVAFEACLPCYLRVFAFVAKAVSALPAEELSILLGLILCFFGGYAERTSRHDGTGERSAVISGAAVSVARRRYETPPCARVAS